MAIREIRPGILWVGALDWDRRLFDELIPLPDGTSYNSYLVSGSSKTALIDTVDPTKEKILTNNLCSAKIQNIDYIVANHAEQDHSGALPAVLSLFPQAKVITTVKGKDILRELLLIPDEKFIVVEDDTEISLGDKTLRFISAPWVHWPETMLTYLKEDKILFTCDFLGSHIATADLFATNEAMFYKAAKRYYAEIMMPFRNHIKKHLRKLTDYEIDLAAPSHGPIWDNPAYITGAYDEWTSDQVKNEVIIPYSSMHGSTAMMVEYLVDALLSKGIDVKPFNLSKTDIGELAIALVDAATVVFASPTVLGGAHPNVLYAAQLANLLRPKTRFASIIGSYGWGGKMVDQILGAVSNLKVEIINPVLIKGVPKREDLVQLDELTDEIHKKHEKNSIN